MSTILPIMRFFGSEESIHAVVEPPAAVAAASAGSGDDGAAGVAAGLQNTG